ncbi:hypothetical protein D3C81_925070 [compost metagenome]
MAERARAELAFDHRRPVAELLAFGAVVAEIGVVACRILQVERGFVTAARLLAEAVGRADGPVVVEPVAQAGLVHLQVRIEVRVGAGVQAAAAADHARQLAAGRQGAGVERRRGAPGVAVLVDAVEGPGQVTRDARVQAQRDRIAVDAHGIAGLAFLVREVQAVAEHIVRAGAAAHVDVLGPYVRRAVAQFHAGRELLGRALGDVVDRAARVAEAVHEAGGALEQFHLFELFVGQRQAVADERHAVDLVRVTPVELQPAHGGVRRPRVICVAVVRDRGVVEEHIADLGHLAVRQVFAGHDGGGERRVELRAVAQRAAGGLLLQLRANFDFLRRAHGHGRQRLLGWGGCRRLRRLGEGDATQRESGQDGHPGESGQRAHARRRVLPARGIGQAGSHCYVGSKVRILT